MSAAGWATEVLALDAEYAAYLSTVRAAIFANAVDGEIDADELAFLLQCGEGSIEAAEVLGYTPEIVDGFARLVIS